MIAIDTKKEVGLCYTCTEVLNHKYIYKLKLGKLELYCCRNCLKELQKELNNINDFLKNGGN